jgi:hypothetical protein
VDERHTTTEIAARLGCGPTTIRRRLKRFDITARHRGTDPVRWLWRRGPGLETCQIWSPEVAYAVGLIATDGNLGQNGRHLAMTSKDIDLLETFRRCLKLRASITKSVTLGPLNIPDEHFADFFRGCIDGDGFYHQLYRPVSHGEEPALRVPAPVCIPRVCQSGVRAVATRASGKADRPPRRCRKEATPGQADHLARTICEARVDGTASLDVLCARPPRACPQATNGRAVSSSVSPGYSWDRFKWGSVGTGRR